MKTVTVLKPHTYRGRQRLVGQTYNLPAAVAILFCKIGRVREEVPLVVKRPLPQDAPVEPEAEPGPEPEQSKPPKRRRYKRRDMTAEDPD